MCVGVDMICVSVCACERWCKCEDFVGRESVKVEKEEEEDVFVLEVPDEITTSSTSFLTLF